MEKIDFATRVMLNKGVEMPVIGLGIWKIYGKKAKIGLL